MSAETSQAPLEVKNGVQSFGPEQQWQMRMMTDVTGQGMLLGNTPQHRLLTLVSSTGAGLFITTPNDSDGFGGPDKLPGNFRDTKHFATQSGDKSRETKLALCNADGSGLRIQAGAGAKPVVHLAIADGTSSITLTTGYIAIQCMGTEMIFHGNEGKITVTYLIVQEHIKGQGTNKMQSSGMLI